MIIYVSVVPGASEDLFEQVSEKEFRVKLKARAEGGKANLELKKVLAKKFNVSILDIVIKNPGARKKIVEIVTLR
ncbi:MAG: DUF167 domain-containing protein [Nanoarchaeota archaeon]|nr:DUF167 domain-containing protein [Nanoarchaeota archaeon]